jgi:alpha-1,6-mannosyltransferase
VSETDGTMRGENPRAAAQPAAAQSTATPPTAAQLAAWAGVAGIVVSLLIMVVVSAAGPNLSVPAVAGAAHPPWWHPLHLSAAVTVVSMWIAMVLGCAGVLAGLVAVARGARLPIRLILGLAFVVVAVLTVLPPAGSTDALSYAVNGRMAAIGHSPYVMTPLQLQRIGDPIGQQAHVITSGLWKKSPSVYGPVATAAEWVAAKLGGTSLAHIAFWLKLLESACFVVVALVLDRMLRRDPAMRLRAHLLWTANPLLLWEIVAAGHIDGLAAMCGLFAVIAVRQDLRATGAFVSGVMVALAAGVKIEYALIGLAVAWASRRSLRALIAAAAGFAVITVPAYVIAGTPAIKVLFKRGPGITSDTMYQLFWRPVLHYTSFNPFNIPPYLELVAYLLFAAVAILAMLRFPDRNPELPVLAPALGLSLAWLFVTAFQRPWYDVMAISLLALYYSTALIDWTVLIRLLAAATVYVIAVPNPVQPHWLYDLGQFDGAWLTPVVFLLATVILIWLCIKGFPQQRDVDNVLDEVPGHRLPLAT